MSVRRLQSVQFRDVAPRITADVILLSAALSLAVFAYLIGWVILWKNYPGPAQAHAALAMLSFEKFLILALAGVAVFASSGFYTRARAYRGRFRALVVSNAVSLTFLLFSFATFLLDRSLPRGVVLLAWLFSIGLVGGARMCKGYVDHTYQIRRKIARRERPVKSVLVIGGAGYIGSVLARRLLRAGFDVRVLDSLMFGEASLASISRDPRFELLAADFRCVDSVVQAVQGMDAVVHLGAIVGDPACRLDSKTSLETNLAATSMIKQVCQGAGIRRLLFASTCSVYGSSQFLLDERSAPAPISLYACTKLDSERILLEGAADFAPTILRLGTAFGWSYRPRFDLVLNLLTARALCEGRITVYNGAQWRPFVHLDDIARAFIACLQAPQRDVAREIFNVGSDSLNTTLAGLAGRIAALVPGTSIELAENSDRRTYRVDFGKITSALGFTCRRTLEDGIGEIRHALASGEVPDYRDARYYNDRTLAGLNQIIRRQVPEVFNGASLEFLRQGGAVAVPPLNQPLPLPS